MTRVKVRQAVLFPLQYVKMSSGKGDPSDLNFLSLIYY